MPMIEPRILVAHNTRLSLKEAEKFGNPICMTSMQDPYPAPDGDEQTKLMIQDDFHFNITYFDPRRDYLLLVGDPIYCGMLLALAWERAKDERVPLKVLRWDRELKVYIPIKVIL